MAKVCVNPYFFGGKEAENGEQKKTGKIEYRGVLLFLH